MLKQFSDELSKIAINSQKYVTHLKLHTTHNGGVASGIVCKDDGIIITNQHVIDSVKSIDVTLSNGEVYSATVIGEDKFTDLAILHIDQSHLPTPQFANSDVLSLGQVVLALGNPLDFQLSITMGIISGLNRSIPNKLGRLMNNMIQTDAALSPGSSGGPLLDIDGRIIGINTAIIIGVAQGLSFTIPSNTVTWVSSTLLKEGVIIRGFLGVAGETIAGNPQTIGSDNQVLRVTGIAKGSPADGVIRYGDHILSIDEKRIKTFDDISKMLNKDTIGKLTKIEIIRDNTIIKDSFTPTKLIL